LDGRNSYTLAPVIDEGVSCLSFHLEDEEQLVFMDILEKYSITRRNPEASCCPRKKF
jgi:hypothetical protein